MNSDHMAHAASSYVRSTSGEPPVKGLALPLMYEQLGGYREIAFPPGNRRCSFFLRRN